MSGATKYTTAPQRDSFDDTTPYSQAPPAYADEAASSDEAALLGGGLRSSEDNIPDDFKVRIRCALLFLALAGNRDGEGKGRI